MRGGREVPKPGEEYRFLPVFAEPAPIQRRLPFGLRVSILTGVLLEEPLVRFVRFEAVDVFGVSEDCAGFVSRVGVAEGDFEKRNGSRCSSSTHP